MWARIKLDIGWRDLAFGLVQCVSPPDREPVSERIERGQPNRAAADNDAFVCFSVRTGFDLVLQALDLPRGSEVLFSALNIKGMVKIARRHDLVAVPLDLGPDDMVPDSATLERAISPRTRAIVVAPLFGTRPDLTALFESARRHNLFIIEDNAQAFSGQIDFGHPDSDVSMFSFGPLKFATALGGAVLRVRDAALLETIRKREATYPIQSTRSFAVRLLKFAGLKLATTRPVLSAVTRLFRATGRDYEDSLSDSVRGVASLGSGKKLRKRCAPAMLALLERRLARFDSDVLAERARVGRRLRDLLGGAVACPGSSVATHHFWAFPIIVDDPDTVMAKLRAQGFDASTLRRSAVVPAPEDRPELEPIHARDTLANLVVLPCYPRIPDLELQRLARAVSPN